MSFDLKYLLIVFAALVCLTIIIGLIIYAVSRSTFYSILSFFVTDNGKTGEHEKILDPVPAPRKHRQKGSSEPLVEVCRLVRKSDDRMRIIEKDGTEKVIDAYYELVFITRKKEELRIACSSDEYWKIPFDTEGSLTYRRNTLVRFKYYEDRKEIIVSSQPDDGRIIREPKEVTEGKLVIFKKTID